MHIVGKHYVDVLVVLAGEHRIQTTDLPGENSHAFVLGGRTVQRYKPKVEEVRSFYQFGHDGSAIKGREGSVVDVGAVIVLEPGETGVLDSIALRRRCRKKYTFRYLLFGLELYFT